MHKVYYKVDKGAVYFQDEVGGQVVIYLQTKIQSDMTGLANQPKTGKSGSHKAIFRSLQYYILYREA